jgi:hypothetical protein
MTVQTCNTPKFGAGRVSNAKSHVTSRVIGVEMYCGPITEVLLYYTDDLVQSGANIILEVQRQGALQFVCAVCSAPSDCVLCSAHRHGAAAEGTGLHNAAENDLPVRQQRREQGTIFVLCSTVFQSDCL